MSRLLNWFTNFYPVWLVGTAVLAFVRPEALLWFSGQWIVWALSVSMLGMGLTLSPADFRGLLKMPGSVTLGFVSQYTLMPLIGWFTAWSLRLEPGFAVGIILVASCPGGMASNMISFLAGANVALSVVLTMASTLLAFIFTPLWTGMLAGQYVPVDAWGLCRSTLQAVVAPVVIGVLCNWRFPKIVSRITPIGPPVAVVALSMITGGIVAAAAPQIASNFGRLVAAASILHALGFGTGYLVSKVFRYPETVARTVSIEVGMQNGGMAAMLARLHFSAQPLAAVPAVFSGVMQNIMGSLLASFWRARPPADARSAGAGGHPRGSIHYWKCDRPAAFHGTGQSFPRDGYDGPLTELLRERFPDRPIALRPADGQGNHITWLAAVDGAEYFVRIEDGPERDDYIEVESRVLAEVRSLGVPVPRVHGADATRRRVPFAWQLLENIPCADLNRLQKEGRLDPLEVAAPIGACVARWQGLRPRGFGPFDPGILRRDNRLEGFHSRYEDYFLLHLDRHLGFLVERGFLPAPQADTMRGAILGHRGLLSLREGCLVHKDLALWNILGTEGGISAFIDFDDAISGDPMDDLSLLGCFHDGAFIARALEGYRGVRPLPEDHLRRFWLHLLRNMIVKAVIRVGAGYFERGDDFFLIGAGHDGEGLKWHTRARLALALRGLETHAEVSIL
ncbi:MAG: phosphotransferase [Verrucomicrobiae bacterium]|nr:phosphotransferase [Verrucomicrobiae bacterium]